MRSVYFGYSNYIDDQGFFKLLEPNPENELSKSNIELFFECDYIRPGSFECYAKSDYKANWSEGLVRKMMPFELPVDAFKEVDFFGAVKMVFFIESSCDFFQKPYRDLKFIGRVWIEKYSYEK